VEPIVDLAPGADDNALAIRFAETVRERLRADPKRDHDFRALRASVFVVAQDTGEAITLRFDHGRLTVHDGALGMPTVTFCGDAASLLLLFELPLLPWLRLPGRLPFQRAGREAWHDVRGLLRRGDLKIYGMVAHPRTVTRLVRLFSKHG
jgi:hypothetical protein